MIQVTKTFLPPQEEYNAILKRAWDKQWLTNRGVLLKELEEKLKAYLAMPNIICTSNGTVPLQIALEYFAKGGEVITTPFSYVATTASIVWQHCTPVFVDIHPTYLTIDEQQIEAAITPKTTAILATHVFGNPCAVEEIARIAQKHQLKVIYDAAHCFGVTYKGKSVFEYGDVSSCSFHATKLFHTGEGGALFANNKQVHEQLFHYHNFGHNGQLAFHGLGINAKMSEMQAAMGLAVLPYMEKIVQARKKVVAVYNQELNFDAIQPLQLREGTQWNYSYYPVLFESEEKLLQVEQALNAQQIFPRRYFYPGLNTLPYVKNTSMPVSDRVYKRVLCLPMSHQLEEKKILLIVKSIRQSI